MFSRSVEYAIRAMAFLALQPPGKLSGAREISEAEKIPVPFLWKILQKLGHRRLVRSFKGAGGGYELARSPAMITLEDIVMAIDGRITDGCILGFDTCSEEIPCPLHNPWREVREKLKEMLEQTTLEKLAFIARTQRRRASLEGAFR